MTNLTKSRRTPLANLPSLCLLLLLSLSLGACMSDESPMGPSADGGPDATGDPDPEVSYYEVQIDLSHFEVVADCDRDPIVGGPNPGEFDYTIEIWGRDYEGVYQKVREFTGSFEKRGGQTYDIDRKVGFRVKNGLNYYVGVKATERDGAFNEDDYVGYDQDVNKAGGQLTYDHELTIGSGGCKLLFYYTAEEIAIF